ncbi:dCTP deaminase [bacterium]|nr:dCTP deaminase [bacterium]
MMLSDLDIREAIKKGWIAVDPFYDKSIRPAGLTLHLGEKLLRPKPGKVVDIKSDKIPDYDEITISMDKPYELQPSEFVLAHTYEKVTVSTKLGFLIEGRSTLARVGLTIVQTAMLVYPGHTNRCVTLELANHGPNAILLYPKMKIARAALIELKTAASIPYDQTGKYRNQEAVGRPIFEDEFFEE